MKPYQRIFKEGSFALNHRHFGNGIMVWNSAKEVHGDYQKIAHIDRKRKVTWYIKNPPKDVINYVDKIVKGENSSVSSSQPYKKVFDENKKICEECGSELTEDGKCPKSGCISQIDGKWRIKSNKTGKLWPQTFDTKEKAEVGLRAYHFGQG